jgi:hypothetical protein
MRILTVSVVLSASMLLSGCAALQLYQLYPAFGTQGGGRLLLYDRRGAHNVLPPSNRYFEAEPTPAPHAQPIR